MAKIIKLIVVIVINWIKLHLYLIHSRLIQIKRRVWNGGVLLWWYRLWTRKDPLHRSLNFDGEALSVMSKKEQEEYINNLLRRREKAHQRARKK